MVLGTNALEAPGLKLEKLEVLKDEVVAASVTAAFMLLKENGLESGGA